MCVCVYDHVVCVCVCVCVCCIDVDAFERAIRVAAGANYARGSITVHQFVCLALFEW